VGVLIEKGSRDQQRDVDPQEIDQKWSNGNQSEKIDSVLGLVEVKTDEVEAKWKW
jgi:hypothetical protein